MKTIICRFIGHKLQPNTEKNVITRVVLLAPPFGTTSYCHREQQCKRCKTWHKV
jgi:hypothetical protein